MRVLHIVATGQRRGGEIFASDLVAAFDKEGVDQEVVVLRAKELHVPYRSPVAICREDRGLGRLLGIDPRTVLRLSGHLRRFRPDVIQAHGGEPFKIAAALPRRHSPIVYRRIGGAPTWMRKGLRRRFHARLMRRADRIVAVAEAVRRETVLDFHVPQDRVVSIPNGVDPERLQPLVGRSETRRSLGIPLESPLIISLGALTWEKDPLGVLEAASLAFKAVPEARLVIAGDGPLREELAMSIELEAMTNRVSLLGPRDDIADLLDASDVLLFASRSDGMEGMPATLIEAGMRGVPAVAYSVAGVSEVVEDGVTGYLVTPGDVQALGRRLAELLIRTEDRTRMARSTAQRCSTRFDIATIARRYLGVYSELCGGRAPAAQLDGTEVGAVWQESR